jgi:hypothetical protein
MGTAGFTLYGMLGQLVFLICANGIRLFRVLEMRGKTAEKVTSRYPNLPNLWQSKQVWRETVQ